ncbi:MAG: tRNA pseudouridine(38-40) synthase TruA [Anaerolineaceae bacterium]|nr:tRNA pseudouridine(38-40) synthase TruA [Anaerolineaceae bacterium]
MNRIGTARYKIILAYDGSNYAGLQRQPSGDSVQDFVEAALRKVGWQGRSIMAAGRTDSGVHADGQVISFDLTWKHDTDTLVRAMNAFLPLDIAVQSAEIVNDEFHARYDALTRAYRYQLYCQTVRHPVKERFAWRIWPLPDMTVMNAAAQDLIGEHDFAAFGKAMKPGGPTVRLVHSSAWQATVDGMQFDIKANAFLYHMVRRIVYVLVHVGLGTLPKDIVKQGLETGSTGIVRLAPAQGLTLVSVDYKE